jgi:carbon starvation protein CstA
MAVVNPGTFFRMFSPLNQVLALIVLLFCWKLGGKIRQYCILTLIVAVALDIFTFAYFFPRNDILFVQPIEGNIEAIETAASEWRAMNWVRSGLGVVNVVFDFIILTLVLKSEK